MERHLNVLARKHKTYHHCTINVGLGIFSTVNYILSLWTGTTQPRHVMLRSLREYCYLLLVLGSFVLDLHQSTSKRR